MNLAVRSFWSKQALEPRGDDYSKNQGFNADLMTALITSIQKWQLRRLNYYIDSLTNRPLSTYFANTRYYKMDIRIKNYFHFLQKPIALNLPSLFATCRIAGVVGLLGAVIPSHAVHAQGRDMGNPIGSVAVWGGRSMQLQAAPGYRAINAVGGLTFVPIAQPPAAPASLGQAKTPAKVREAIYSAPSGARGTHPFSANEIMYKNINAATIDNITSVESGIDQTTYSDCFYESSIGSLALSPRGASLLSNMIEADGAGGWSVTFLDQPNNPYSVSRGQMLRMHLTDSAAWADILEAAFFNRFPLMLRGLPGATAQHKIWAGMGFKANNQFSLTMLTGHLASSESVASLSMQQLIDILTRAAAVLPTGVNVPYAVAAGAMNLPNPTNTILAGKHCYSVVKYDPASQIVTVRNPWGKNNPTREFPNLVTVGQTKGGITNLGGGILQMNVATFKRHFENIGYSRIFQG